MKKQSIALVVLVGLVFAGGAGAQTAGSLPQAGVTPGSPFFFLDRFFEGVGTFFTFGEANKARRYLALAEERLAEAQAVAERQDTENTARAAELYEQQFAQAQARAERTGELDLEGEVADATTRHLAVFDEVLERVPEQARASVQAAKERTMTGQLEALRGIAQRDPERAVGIFAAAAEGRLKAAQARAERGDDDEEEAEGVQEALGEYEQYAAFGEEISQTAQGLGTGETAVRDLVDRATQQHLQVLQDVQEKVPPQAQERVRRALENAERVRQLLPSDIPGRVGPGAPRGEDEEQEGAPEGTAPDQGSQFVPPEAQERIPQQPGAPGGAEEEEQPETGAPQGLPVPEAGPGGAGGNETEEEPQESEDTQAPQQGGPPAGVPGGGP